MSRLADIGAADGWRCWVCDEPVDQRMSVNHMRGPSIDSVTTARKAKANTKTMARTKTSKGAAAAVGNERLAHRVCNTRKGAVAAIVPWADHLFVVDPAPIMTSVERLQRKAGREIMARCPTRADADDAATWLTDRVSRLAPDLAASADVEPGGGQFLVILRA